MLIAYWNILEYPVIGTPLNFSTKQAAKKNGDSKIATPTKYLLYSLPVGPFI